MVNTRKKDVCSLICTILLVGLGALGQVQAYREIGWRMYCYYTLDSNLLLLLCSLLWGVFLVRRVRDGVAIPSWVRCLKFTATCTTTLTFFVVFTVLLPMGFDRSELFTAVGAPINHIICPVLGIVTLLAFEGEPEITGVQVWMSMVPTVLYGMVAAVLNIVRVWYGPYPFLHVYEQPVWISVLWFAALMVAAWLIAVVLRAVNRAAHREYVY